VSKRTVFNDEIFFLVYKWTVGVKVATTAFVNAVEDMSADTTQKNRNLILNVNVMITVCKL